MNDLDLQRYGRHILLDEIGIEGQQSYIDARVLIVGLGGLGSPAALYLASSGIGQLTLCDHDTVDLSNLQRQIAHRTSAIGKPKVSSASSSILDINPNTRCTEIQYRATPKQLNQLVAINDIVLDCSDNFETRYAINRACFTYKKPLISGAAIQFSGQAAVFDFRQIDAPCYNCLFPENAESEALRCATTGIFAPLTGMIGSIQASETLKLLAGISTGLGGKLFTLNALDMRTRLSSFSKDPDCSVCGLARR